MALKQVDPLAQSGHDTHEVRDYSHQTWLTVPEATDYLRFPSVAAFRQWVRRYGIASAHKGRAVMFLRRDLDAAVLPGRKVS